MSDALPYLLLDSGDGRKLESVGGHLIERQASVAIWRRRHPDSEWNKALAVHHRSEKGGGHWEFRKPLPESWNTSIGGLVLQTKLTSFGHLGFFAEQASEWEWFRKTAPRIAEKLGRAPRILNLFGYTGCSSLALAQGGAEVTHVDAAKGIVDWGKINQSLNSVPEGKIRWIVDDCLEFVKREHRRGKTYDGVILDPPSYGRGPNKEIFKIEDHLGGLLTAISRVLEPNPSLVHFSCHTPGFTAQVLDNLVLDLFEGSKSLKSERGEMTVPEQGTTRLLSSGSYCRMS